MLRWKCAGIAELAAMTNALDDISPRWITAAESPFGSPIFDCRSMALHTIGASDDPERHVRFTELRQSDGSHVYGTRPDKAVRLDVHMEIELSRSLPDRGPLFQAASMDEKWDIYRDGSLLYFVRSWSGELIYVTDVVQTQSGIAVHAVVVSEADIEPSDPFFHARVVNYLLWSHVADVVYPHPIPRDAQSDEEILTYSHSAYGRRGWFAVRDEFGSAEQM